MALVLTALALLATAPASAQRYREARPTPRSGDDLSTSIQTLEWTLQQQRAPEVLVRQAHALADRVARDGRRSGQAYARMRRLMHSSFYEPSDAELDAWYEVAFAWRLGHRGARPAPVRPVVQPAPSQPLLTFNGAIEGAPVFWSAPTHQQLRAQCQASMGQSGFGNVDDIQIFGVAHHNGPSFWDAQAICAIVAANARLQRPVPGMVALDGDIEGAPFHFEGQVAEVHQAIQALIPTLVGTTNVDDVTINGQRYHNGPGFWSPAQVAEMVAQRALALSQAVQPSRSPRGHERQGYRRGYRGARTAPQPWSARTGRR